MLVGLEDARTGKGHYDDWVMLRCPTKGIVDGKFWTGGEWKDITGKSAVAVTDTVTYKTADGTQTVFVLEPADPEPEPVQIPDKTIRPSGKPGPRAYDNAPEQLRERFVQDYHDEIAALRKAIARDQARLRMARSRAESLKWQQAIAGYQGRLAKLGPNNPPYFNKEGQQALNELKEEKVSK
jgi:hypothetical protein